MEIKVIRIEADYRAALQEVSALIDLDPAVDSPDGERLEVMGALVQAYEAKHYSMVNLLAQCDAQAPFSAQDREWLDASPVGLEDIS